MKFNTKFYVGLAAAMLTAGAVFVGANSSVPPPIIAGIVGAIAWLASWSNGRNNTP